MIEISIPGYTDLKLNHLVLDYNGTLACDGHLIDGIKVILKRLSAKIAIHVITADTFGIARAELDGLPVTLTILPLDDQDETKLAYVRQLGPASVVAVGNGRNDRLMLMEAELGLAVIQEEGAAGETVKAADVICRDIISALELLTDSKRLIATLRS